MKRLSRIVTLLLITVLVFSNQGIVIMAEETAALSENSSETEIKTETETENNLLNLPEIGMIYVETMEIELSGTQHIALIFDGEIHLDTARLRYTIGEDNTEHTMDMETHVENVLLFSETYTEETSTGIYKLIGFTYEIDGQINNVDFEKETIYSVGVAGAIVENEDLLDITDVNSLAELADDAESISASVVSLEDEESIVDITNAIENAQSMMVDDAIQVATFSLARVKKDLVVVLDPGHCTTHDNGAVRGTLNETVLNLKIAQYAKAELETYDGVIVHLTRTGSSCTFGSNFATCLSGRATFAKSVNADVFISFHINSTATQTTTANGAESIITIHSQHRQNMYNLSASILAELKKVGLNTRSIYTSVEDKNNGKYTDGNWQDDYSVIRNSALNGIPAMILEHAFINNWSDQQLLNNEAGLKRIGIADATGIAKYYGLSKRGSSGVVDKRQLVRDFVSRHYVEVMGREADAGGLEYWTNMLENQHISGGDLVMNFLNSEEFRAKRMTDETYVRLLYTTTFNRQPDTTGLNYWREMLRDGLSRTYVAVSFLNSPEFADICNQYGIIRGIARVNENRDVNVAYTKFVARLYTKAFDRNFDVSGLNYWTGLLNSKKITPEQVAENFFLSAEMQAKRYTNTQYVTVLYRTFLDREPDAEGRAYHLGRLNSGVSRLVVLYGFSRSAEFSFMGL
jgi:N-acetylmuramoyl-L-alanine amidase